MSKKGLTWIGQYFRRTLPLSGFQNADKRYVTQR
jgi:hypothetical protein